MKIFTSSFSSISDLHENTHISLSCIDRNKTRAEFMMAEKSVSKDRYGLSWNFEGSEIPNTLSDILLEVKEFMKDYTEEIKRATSLGYEWHIFISWWPSETQVLSLDASMIALLGSLDCHIVLDVYLPGGRAQDTYNIITPSEKLIASWHTESPEAIIEDLREDSNADMVLLEWHPRAPQAHWLMPENFAQALASEDLSLALKVVVDIEHLFEDYSGIFELDSTKEASDTAQLVSGRYSIFFLEANADEMATDALVFSTLSEAFELEGIASYETLLESLINYRGHVGAVFIREAIKIDPVIIAKLKEMFTEIIESPKNTDDSGFIRALVLDKSNL